MSEINQNEVVLEKHIPVLNKIQTNNQDFKQKTNVFMSLILELYRALMGSFLVIFVPQLCDNNDICSIQENINRPDIMSEIAIVCNVVTMFSFMVLYYIEVKRENKLITYLEVNKFTPCDNDNVEKSLIKLSDDKKNSIWEYDRYYLLSGYISSIAFVVNSVISTIVIYNNYLDNKTLTVYLTNLLFMGSKVTDVFSTVNTEKNIFYSAYLKDKVQFNDVDPDKILHLDYEHEVEEMNIHDKPSDQ